MLFRLTTADALILAILMTIPQVVFSAERGGMNAAEGRLNPTAPGQTVAAGYLSLRNSTPKVQTIVSASSPVAEIVEIHQVSMTGGVARMRKIELLSIPSGSQVRFAPGGYHLMFQSLRSRLLPGQTVPLKLRMANGQTLDVPMTVGPSLPAQTKEQTHHGHH
ncbi:copper chaperone PCu(A)C [Novosphingobium sp. MW5]|nr:copper chaperone PCu(A)C [Novosphingobium sp. MW5]